MTELHITRHTVHTGKYAQRSGFVMFVHALKRVDLKNNKIHVEIATQQSQ